MGDGVWCRSFDLDAGTHFVPVRVFQPDEGSRGLLVWAHGGSWHMGSVEQWHLATEELACVSRWTVISVGYRLAPQHRHPAQLDDVLTALAWAEASFGEENGPLAVGGDSAGGTIAACRSLRRCSPTRRSIPCAPRHRTARTAPGRRRRRDAPRRGR
ncbi:alpha/beta hydrolase fold domain-containing protein [Microbispora amethystogenes]|uniref:alpha/beta hydrolase n=1 Tax=Microbispora amethystogenes TaxID=1427754 RepID=UPI0033F5D6A3